MNINFEDDDLCEFYKNSKIIKKEQIFIDYQ